jgi:hypothetical protein
MLALLFGAVFLMTIPGQDAPFAHDSRFIVTARPSIALPSGATITQHPFVWWLDLQRRFRGPSPLTYVFRASPTRRCSIHPLLSQCTEATGVRYVIAKEVAVGGSVLFGLTNDLNGAQWAKAFTEALRTGQPEWWDPQTKRIRKENLVVLTNDARTVLVLPKEMARELQREKGD